MREARRALHPRTHDALAAARKAIVLLNRRGWSNFLSCRSCGRAWECPSCDVTLVLHRAQALLACHHCGHREGVPSRCPDCGSVSIARHGTGTERLSDELSLGVPVFRLDGDVRDPGAVLAAFEAAPRGILVGTQMVAKGHDFPDVDLGVVVDADATLRFPDFRAEERTFALVTQLAGRAGRGAAGGRVLVQTLAPDGPVDHARRAARRGRVRVGRARVAARAALPAVLDARADRVLGAGRGRGRGGGARAAGARAGAGAAQAAAAAVRARLDGAAGAALGPAPLFRLRGRERSQVVVKATDRRAAVAAIDAAVQAVAADRASRGVSFSVDVDPQ